MKMTAAPYLFHSHSTSFALSSLLLLCFFVSWMLLAYNNLNEMNFNEKVDQNKNTLANKWDLRISKLLIIFQIL